MLGQPSKGHLYRILISTTLLAPHIKKILPCSYFWTLAQCSLGVHEAIKVIKFCNFFFATGNAARNIIGILDLFGFEDFTENSFEQLCINYANENLHYYINKLIFKTEQAEYAKEKIEWTPITYFDNQPILHILSKVSSSTV